MNFDLNDKGFLEKLFCTGFSGYIEKGLGCVIIREPTEPLATEGPLITYVAYDPLDGNFPMEAETMMSGYNPQKEIILAVMDRKNRAFVLQLTSQQTGLTPVEAYRAWSKAHGKGRFIPGEVLHLDQPIGELEQGYYIFLERDLSFMKICKAGIDEDEGDLVSTGNVYRVHCDFEDSFKGVLDLIVELP